jgi:hypothetical protein
MRSPWPDSVIWPRGGRGRGSWPSRHLRRHGLAVRRRGRAEPGERRQARGGPRETIGARVAEAPGPVRRPELARAEFEGLRALLDAQVRGGATGSKKRCWLVAAGAARRRPRGAQAVGATGARSPGASSGSPYLVFHDGPSTVHRDRVAEPRAGRFDDQLAYRKAIRSRSARTHTAAPREGRTRRWADRGASSPTSLPRRAGGGRRDDPPRTTTTTSPSSSGRSRTRSSTRRRTGLRCDVGIHRPRGASSASSARSRMSTPRRTLIRAGYVIAFDGHVTDCSETARWWSKATDRPVGPRADERHVGQVDETVEAGDRVLTPGLISTTPTSRALPRPVVHRGHRRPNLLFGALQTLPVRDSAQDAEASRPASTSRWPSPRGA